MPEYEMTLVDQQRIARDTMAFWFDTKGASFAFRAGQHADFVFKPPRTKVKATISGPYHSRALLMTPFKTALKSTALGTKFIVSRPRGSFTLHRDFSRPAVFLASSIGISAIRCVLRKADQKRLPHGLYLFYSTGRRTTRHSSKNLSLLRVRDIIGTRHCFRSLIRG